METHIKQKDLKVKMHKYVYNAVILKRYSTRLSTLTNRYIFVLCAIESEFL